MSFRSNWGRTAVSSGFHDPPPGGQAQVSFMQVSSTDSNREEPAESGTIDPELAEQLARDAFQQRLGGVTGIDFEGPDRSIDDEGTDQSIDFSWLGKSETNQELGLRYRVSIVQDRLNSEAVSADLDEDFADQKYPLNSPGRIVAYSAMGVVAFFLSAYALFLYLRPLSAGGSLASQKPSGGSAGGNRFHSGSRVHDS